MSVSNINTSQATGKSPASKPATVSDNSSNAPQFGLSLYKNMAKCTGLAAEHQTWSNIIKASEQIDKKMPSSKETSTEIGLLKAEQAKSLKALEQCQKEMIKHVPQFDSGKK